MSPQLEAALSVWRRALAEEGRADASVDLPVARRYGARGAKRADGVRASVGQSRRSSDLHRKRLKHMIENGDEPPVPLKLGRVSSE
jgi:hypothetical protein